MRLGFVWTQEQNDNRYWSTQNSHLIHKVPIYDIKVGVCWAKGGTIMGLELYAHTISYKYVRKVLQVGWQPSLCDTTAASHVRNAAIHAVGMAHLLNTLPMVPLLNCSSICNRQFHIHDNLKVLPIYDDKPCTESIFHHWTAHNRADNVAAWWLMMLPVPQHSVQW
jgi:hypothetical protein